MLLATPDSALALGFTEVCRNVFGFLSVRVFQHRNTVPKFSVLPEEINRIRKTWQAIAIADPSHHDPRNFRYLVHAAETEYGDVESVEKYFGGFPDREFIHLSLVSNEKRDTFYDKKSGYILSVPPENLVASSALDMSFEKLRDAEIIFGLHTPDELLAQTGLAPYSPWNDVKATGTKGESKVSVVGLFYKEGIHWKAFERLKSLSEKTGLVLIKL